MWITSMGNHGVAGVSRNAGVLVVLVLTIPVLFFFKRTQSMVLTVESKNKEEACLISELKYLVSYMICIWFCCVLLCCVLIARSWWVMIYSSMTLSIWKINKTKLYISHAAVIETLIWSLPFGRYQPKLKAGEYRYNMINFCQALHNVLPIWSIFSEFKL